MVNDISTGIDSIKGLLVTATFSLVEDRTAVVRQVLQMYSTCLTCITAGIWHKEALSQNQQQEVTDRAPPAC